MKKEIVLLFIGLTSVASMAMASDNVAIGESRLNITYSQVLNILTQRNAETAALEKALQTIVQTCHGEKFQILSQNYRSQLVQSQILLQAQVSFKCR